MVTRAEVDAATVRIQKWVRRTPLATANPGTLFDPLWMKCEFMQCTGTFKARGAFNHILMARESGELDPVAGIVVASGGNAGLAFAYAAAQFAVPATVYVPRNAPPVKVAKLRAIGATVVEHGTEYATAHQGAVKHAGSTGALYCHAYDQPAVVAGAGTLGTELLEQLDGNVDTILVAVGGGGLLAGIATAADGRARVIAVEPRTIPTLHAALEHGGPVEVDVSGIAADSLGARRVGDIAYTVAVHTGVRSVLVSDEDIIAARRALWEQWRLVVEHAAATAFAALTSGTYQPEPGERTVVVLCGANTDPSDL